MTAGKVSSGKFFVDITATASNGKSICGFTTGSVFNVNVKVEKAGKFKILFVGACDSDYDVAKNIKFTLGGKELTVTGNLKGTADKENNIPAYFDWQTIEVCTTDLAVGDHVLTITISNGAPNFDCVIFEAVTE